MKTKILRILVLALIPYSIFSVDLTVEIVNRKSQTSKILCDIFEKEEGFPSESHKRMRGTVASSLGAEKAICEFKNLDPKTYAVSIMEDLNGNEKMDTNFVGIPKEPWGVSNNAKMQPFDPPTFRDSSFLLKETTKIQIKLNQ